VKYPVRPKPDNLMPQKTRMPSRPLAVIVSWSLLVGACLFYLAVRTTTHRMDAAILPSVRTIKPHWSPTPDSRSQHEYRFTDQGGRGSCGALSLSCASKYFSAWKWPVNGGCATSLRNGYPVPDARCTPGGIVPGLTADVLRDRQWRTRCIRNCQSSNAQKHVTYEWYGVARPADNSGQNQVCELDHLVPIELGGADGLGNIWPECGPDENALQDRYFKYKDRVEGYLAARVLSGEMPLEQAQVGIAADWTQYLVESESFKRKPRTRRGSRTTMQ
jgi:hypothetical protein